MFKNIKISFDVELYHSDCDLIDEGIADLIKRELNYWDEGRYYFCSEMIRNGLDDAVKAAITKHIQRKFYKIYENETVETGKGSKTSKAILESEKIIKELHIGVQIKDDTVEVNYGEEK